MNILNRKCLLNANIAWTKDEKLIIFYLLPLFCIFFLLFSHSPSLVQNILLILLLLILPDVVQFQFVFFLLLVSAHSKLFDFKHKIYFFLTFWIISFSILFEKIPSAMRTFHFAASRVFHLLSRIMCFFSLLRFRFFFFFYSSSLYIRVLFLCCIPWSMTKRTVELLLENSTFIRKIIFFLFYFILFFV